MLALSCRDGWSFWQWQTCLTAGGITVPFLVVFPFAFIYAYSVHQNLVPLLTGLDWPNSRD